MDPQLDTILLPEPTPEYRHGFFRYVGLIILGILIGVLIWILHISSTPPNFQKDTIVTVYSGMTIKDLSSVLESDHIVRSAPWFHVILSTRWKNKPIVVGDYIFEKPQNAFSIAYRLSHGIYGNSRIKVTFPEGITVKSMGDILSKSIPNFPAADFIMAAKDKEGFLFPETYYFFRTSSVENVITTLSNQFTEKMKSFAQDFNGDLTAQAGKTTNAIYGKTRSLHDVITMASILEREAKNKDEAKTIAGILWKRISKNMPMQVDATFLYTIQKGTSSLTMSDLHKDGPYNTYTRTGLPAGPIGNPGRDMIDAALHPIDSPYWYYLHDDQGVIHYAKTYQEHLKNKQKYLK